MQHVLLPYDKLKERGITWSKCQLYRLERAGKFPKRVAVSDVRIAWVESEIDAWIIERINARDVR